MLAFSVNIDVIRIGEGEPQVYVEEIVKTNRNVVLLARGTYISKAVDVTCQLIEKGYELFTQKELGFGNPEIGTWYFEQQDKTVSFMRIWLRKKS